MTLDELEHARGEFAVLEHHADRAERAWREAVQRLVEARRKLVRAQIEYACARENRT